MKKSLFWGDKMSSDPRTVAFDLVCSLLSVNRWALDRVFGISEGIEKESLFDIDGIARMTHQEVKARLIRAGCSRGDYVTGLLADRLLNVAHALAGQGLSRLCALLDQHDIDEIDKWLLSIKGIGPHVLENFKMLQGLE